MTANSDQTKAVYAVVPVKDLDAAKQRLAPVLSQRHRSGLYRAMLLDVLSVLASVPSLAGIVVVTRDAEVRALAAPFDVSFLREPSNDGHTMAVTRAAQMLTDTGADGLLQVPGDVPDISVADVESLLAAHRQPPAVTISPSRDYRGSNAILCSPPGVLPFAFGNDSFYPHLQAARQLGIEPTVVVRPGIGLDIDQPEDLQVFVSRPSATRAYAYLKDNDLLDRF